MNSVYLNALLNSCRQTMETIFQSEWSKTNVYVTEFFETAHSHLFYFQMEGALHGMFALSFPVSTGNEMCNRMTGGVATTMDEFGKSALEEAGNMIKGGVITSLSSYNLDIPEVLLLEKNELVPFPTLTLVVSATSEVGEVAFHFSIFENENR